MKKMIRSLVLATTVAFGTASLVTFSGSSVQGQVKGKDVPKTGEVKSKEGTKAPEAKGSVLIKQDKQGKYRFQVKDEENVLMQSVKGYDSAADAIKAFEAALDIAKRSKPVVEKNGK